MSFPNLSAWLCQSWRPHRRPLVSLHLEELEHRTVPSVTVVPQQFTTNQYTALTITQDQLQAGDSGTVPLTVSNPTQPANATLADNHNGTFTFTPNPSFSGSTTFQYTVGGTSQTTLTPTDGTSVVVTSVSIDGDTAVIGESANAFVFVRSGATWSQQAVLTVSDNNGGFGTSVAVSGDTAVIGSNSPQAYVFVRSAGTWTQQAILTPTDGTGGSFDSVSVSGDTAIIGDKNNTFSGGAAFVFVRSGSTWSQQTKFTPDTPVDGFGASVSISGDTAVIAEIAKQGTTPQTFLAPHPVGAYVFVRSGGTWSRQAILTASQGGIGDGFPVPVSISGDTAVIGDAGSGTAYVFVRSGSTWSQQAMLTPVFSGSGFVVAHFGGTVAVSGDTAVVGGIGNSTVYVFTRLGTTWNQQAEIPGTGGPLNSVSISGDTAVIGGGIVPGTSATAYAEDLSFATATATVQVNPATAPLTISPASLPNGVPGVVYASPTFTAMGGAGSGYTFQESGLLPPGLTFDPTTAHLTGTPTQVGTFPGIVIAASDGHGGSGSQTYTLNIDYHAIIRSLYRTVLNRDVENDAALNYWENIFSAVTTNPQTLGLPAGTDPYLYVAQGFWESQEHRWREVESYYHTYLGRDLDLNNAFNLSERQYWTNQFLFAGAQEADVIRGFLTSPEYLFKHQADASLANALNTNLLSGAATTADLQTWTTDLKDLDAQRAALKDQTFATPEDYKAQLSASLGALDDESAQTGVLFDMLGSNEYRQAALDSFYLAFLRRAGTQTEEQALLGQHDANGNPLSLGTIAEMMLASSEYRTNAVNSEVL